MGPCGYNARNNRGDWSVHIAQSYNLKTDNIFFKKIPKSKWTCCTPKVPQENKSTSY